jgi:hypothetical protein
MNSSTEKAVLSEIFGRGGCVDQLNEIITGPIHKGAQGRASFPRPLGADTTR